MAKKHTAIILAGGKSSRMGTPKAFLPVKNKPVIEHLLETLKPHFGQILISSSQKGVYKYLNVPIIKDEIKNQGPLIGIYSCLKQSESEKNFVIACDIPEINMGLVKKMLTISEGYDIVIPQNKGNLEPLFAVYSKQVTSSIEKLLFTGSRKMTDLIPFCKTKLVEAQMNNWYRNLNVRSDYEQYILEVI